MGETRHAGLCSCIDWSLHPQRRGVINHLAPVSTRCTSFPLVVRIARARDAVKRGARGEKRGAKRSRSRSRRGGDQFFSLSLSLSFSTESATRVLPSLPCHATRSPLRDSRDSSCPRSLLYRAIGRRKNAILVAPRGIISAFAAPSTRRTGARRIMQSRLARRSSPSVLAPQNALAPSPPSIIGYRRHVSRRSALRNRESSRVVGLARDRDHARISSRLRPRNDYTRV